jgi:hypothetical protein
LPRLECGRTWLYVLRQSSISTVASIRFLNHWRHLQACLLPDAVGPIGAHRVSTSRQKHLDPPIREPRVLGGIDWDGFERRIVRTQEAGLACAVNMDTGFGDLLSVEERRAVLAATRRALGDGASTRWRTAATITIRSRAIEKRSPTSTGAAPCP